MKKFTYIVLTLIFVMLLTCATLAYDYPPLLVDDADLLTDSEESDLTDRLNELSEKWNFDVVILTVDSIGVKSPQNYADDYYDYNGYGRDSQYSGILLLISMEERDWAFSTCGVGIEVFSDRDLDYIADSMIDDLGRGYYADAFESYINRVDYCLESYNSYDEYSGGNNQAYDDGYSYYDYDYYSADRGPGIGTKIMVSLVVGVIAGFIGVSIMKSGMRTIRQNNAASDYTVRDSMNLHSQKDIYLYRTVTKTRRQTENTSGPNRSGGHSGGSIHTGSSGRSHGGRSGKF